MSQQSDNKRTRSRQLARVVTYAPDPDLRAAVADRLTAEQFDLEVTALPPELLRAVARRPADLVVLSLRPDHGWEHLDLLRRSSDALILALLWRHDDIEPSDVLDAGADDVIELPFGPRLLGARCRALLRRQGRFTPSPTGLQPLRFDGLVIDPSARQVAIGPTVVFLPTREFDLLIHLATRPRVVFTREELLRDVWGVDFDAGVGRATVTEHVRRLRERIHRPETPCRIVTIRGVGYRFDPGPSRLSADDSDPDTPSSE